MRRTRLNAGVAFAGMALIAGCSVSDENGQADGDTSGATGLGEATWDAPDDYEFTLRSRCGNRNDLGVYEITVEDGEVTNVDAPHWERIGQERGSIGFTSEYAGDAPTLSELAAEADAADAAGADVVELSTDPADGRPTRLDIDWDEEAIDDEACFIVGDYSVTDR